ncbi:hypothetical protein mRhiFer1_008902 [Rhinolophus ferrumequinum]|uniref:Uncharacterized protein n=1 Tax=Rhinolophus ferrumequinum TaxID=59479 RepID=A0A7J7TEM4_RHIFE|nr:hypothetical protein mRhiFer1_008902 [Rhinolophus ferrumequinum]
MRTENIPFQNLHEPEEWARYTPSSSALSQYLPLPVHCPAPHLNPVIGFHVQRGAKKTQVGADFHRTHKLAPAILGDFNRHSLAPSLACTYTQVHPRHRSSLQTHPASFTSDTRVLLPPAPGAQPPAHPPLDRRTSPKAHQIPRHSKTPST